MRLYLDTEFSENGYTIDLISIGIVSETGQEFYRQSAEFDPRKCNEWVQQNVLPQLWPCPKSIPGPRHMYGACADPTCVWRSRRQIREELWKWVQGQTRESPATGIVHDKPEFWGYFADYDWVVLCQLFGAMVNLPPGWPMFCRDIEQYCDMLLHPDGKHVGDALLQTGEHNALSDARWNREAHLYLMQYERSFYAGKGHEQSVSTRQVDQEPGHLRSAEGEGHAEVSSGGDLELGAQQDRQAGQAPGEEGTVILGEEGVAFV